MAGVPTVPYADPYGGYVPPGTGGGMNSNRSAPSHVSFMIWLVVIGIVLPAVILGGLRMGGFSFVFKGR